MTRERWQLISAVYHEALARRLDSRGLYLREACAGDDELRREVEALLAADGQSAIVDAPAVAAVARGVASESPSFVGRSLGVYKIVKLLGVGGMGEVYQARDTRLDRLVAIKILPPALAADSQFRERFAREARSISRLDHPHICTLYDVGEHEGTSFIVMQYLEGETLEKRLEKGPLPLQQALRYAIEIAGALDKAHRAGIVHRDLKPGNIMLTKSGATLLDFGLAKMAAVSSIASATSEAALPATTITKGVLLGTLAYMAPEQIDGRDADARTDIFAFGITLHEMLTGQRASADKHQALTPPALDHTVGRCLAGDPDDRWQTAADLLRELEWVETEDRPQPSDVGGWLTPGRIVSVAVVAVTLAAAAAFGMRDLRAPARDGLLMRLTIPTPPHASLAFGGAGQPGLAISPDGTRLAFVAQRDGTMLLFVRALDSLESHPIEGTEGAALPFWSPEGRTVGFFTEAKTLKTVDVVSGHVRVLGSMPSGAGFGAAWGADGTIVIGSTSSGLLKTTSAGGPMTPLRQIETTTRDSSERFPVFLPDGRHLMYWSFPSNTAWLTSVDAPDAHQIMGSDSPIKYLAPGYLLFGRQDALMAQPFDWRRGALSGTAIGIAEQVARHVNNNALIFDASANGTIAYVNDAGTPLAQLTWFDSRGKRLGTVGSPAPYRNPTLSPDGKRVAIEITNSVNRTQDIWLLDVDTGEPSRFTFDPANDIQPVWSPNGDRILFGSDRSGVFNVYQRPSNGAGRDELVAKSSAYMSPSGFTPDASAVIYRTVVAGLMQVGTLPLVGARTPRLFDRKPASYSQGRVSPDGKWLASCPTNQASRRSGSKAFQRRAVESGRFRGTGAARCAGNVMGGS